MELMELMLEKRHFSKSDNGFNHYNSISYSKLSSQETITNRACNKSSLSSGSNRVTFINMPTISHVR